MKLRHTAVLPAGFAANAISCGIKKSGKPDLALFYSRLPAKAACLFTSNRVQAAPLKVSQRHLGKNKFFRAIVVNSGNANCFTGGQGVRDAWETCRFYAGHLGVPAESVLVNSTGIIGRRLPVEKIIRAAPSLVSGLCPAGIAKAKRAILTTDSFAKQATAEVNLGSRKVVICWIAKGAGMISPNLATLLCFIFTDADIAQAALKKALRQAVDQSFNRITVDGCMSTNDSVMLLANAAAGNRLVSAGRDLKIFSRALAEVCRNLALAVVRDAEGATKFIRICVNGAAGEKEAKTVALQIANSALVKTAAFASSANIVGRIIAACGASGARIDEAALKVKYSLLHKRDIDIEVTVGSGRGAAVIYTSDLSYEYVKINAEYN